MIKFIINDLKKDFLFIKDCLNGNVNFNEKSKLVIYNIKKIGFLNILKENWIFFLVIFLSLVTGYFLGSVVAQNQCNEYIYHEITKKDLVFNMSPFIPFFVNNISNVKCNKKKK
jgi:hypothetical protein